MPHVNTGHLEIGFMRSASTTWRRAMRASGFVLCGLILLLPFASADGGASRQSCVVECVAVVAQAVEYTFNELLVLVGHLDALSVLERFRICNVLNLPVTLNDDPTNGVHVRSEELFSRICSIHSKLVKLAMQRVF